MKTNISKWNIAQITSTIRSEVNPANYYLSNAPLFSSRRLNDLDTQFKKLTQKEKNLIPINFSESLDKSFDKIIKWIRYDSKLPLKSNNSYQIIVNKRDPKEFNFLLSTLFRSLFRTRINEKLSVNFNMLPTNGQDASNLYVKSLNPIDHADLNISNRNSFFSKLVRLQLFDLKKRDMDYINVYWPKHKKDLSLVKAIGIVKAKSNLVDKYKQVFINGISYPLVKLNNIDSNNVEDEFPQMGKKNEAVYYSKDGIGIIPSRFISHSKYLPAYKSIEYFGRSSALDDWKKRENFEILGELPGKSVLSKKLIVCKKDATDNEITGLDQNKNGITILNAINELSLSYNLKENTADAIRGLLLSPNSYFYDTMKADLETPNDIRYRFIGLMKGERAKLVVLNNWFYTFENKFLFYIKNNKGKDILKLSTIMKSNNLKFWDVKILQELEKFEQKCIDDIGNEKQYIDDFLYNLNIYFTFIAAEWKIFDERVFVDNSRREWLICRISFIIFEKLVTNKEFVNTYPSLLYGISKKIKWLGEKFPSLLKTKEDEKVLSSIEFDTNAIEYCIWDIIGPLLENECRVIKECNGTGDGSNREPITKNHCIAIGLPVEVYNALIDLDYNEDLRMMDVIPFLSVANITITCLDGVERVEPIIGLKISNMMLDNGTMITIFKK
ncbi:uncharacterized protein SCDLUD_001341 [Saccharomycodes ludwigii]|uniref:uncharacterized protein n=1 Tax=Saccharomycodes ludwigii TaxID=36035 RepID=UPI001E86E96A|nr:hypothetical protein SCDLUD_001341 [Saccharomycodes ludwigii]KAH3901578.1 hypothetical protein SCDLUD_001341 [Saccharomycodes ludwigii]